MNVLLFEYVAGGGWWEVSNAAPTGGLLAEGAAMLAAAAKDFSHVPGVHLTALHDVRVRRRLPASVTAIDVDSAAALQDCFQRAAEAADCALVIAPETDGALERFAQLACRCGAELIGPPPHCIRVAADKNLTASALSEAGVATPRGVTWSAGRCWPAIDDVPFESAYPLVWKPVDGCGSQDVRLVRSPADAQPATAGRLEEFVPGMPASCLVLCGPDLLQPLPPCRQELSQDGRFQLQGLTLIEDARLAQRAQDLAAAAVAALPGARGLVGVDFVLSDERDVVIEVNPRLTTSYLLVRNAVEGNLAAAMLDSARGKAIPGVRARPHPRGALAISPGGVTLH